MDRALSIAQLPVQAMQNQQADLIVKKQTLNSLGSKVQALSDAVAALGALGTRKGLVATSSNSAKVSVSLNGATAPATYLISDITSVAQRASESTAAGLASLDADAVDATDNILKLVFDGQAYTIDLSTYGNNLNGLQEAISDTIAEEGLGLTVSLIDSGHATTPHHLTLSATGSGSKKLELWTGDWTQGGGGVGSNLLTSVNQGANAEFKINGVSVSKTDNLITGVAPGVTLTIGGTTGVGETVTVDVSSNRSSVKSALESFVTAYNALAQELNAQIGENAGLLSGDYLITHAKGVLREITGYKDLDSSIRSLADLGIELNQAGEMSLDTTAFNALSNQEIGAAFEFFGSESAGFGALASKLDQLSDPVLADMFDSQIRQYDTADARLQTQIDTLSERITMMQSTLFLQLQQADVLLASLESQQKLLDASIEAINYSMYGRKDG
jgi:flagellar hook-associated protein 2